MKRQVALAVVTVMTATLSAGVIAGASISSAPRTAPPITMYYLSLGDSYATGYQPGYADNSETLDGFPDQLNVKLAADLVPMTLENFACGRATTDSVMNRIGCTHLALNSPTYPTTTQAQAVLDFIATHPGQIGLITVALAFNDFNRCSNFVRSCVISTMRRAHTQRNSARLTNQLRAAVGPSVPILAVTYPDVFLGDWLGSTHDRQVAARSATMFRTVINPLFARAYAHAKVVLVDVTADTNAYVPTTLQVNLNPYGSIPESVAQVCTLTWFCQRHDVHPQTAGYTAIATLLEQAYLKSLTSSQSQS